MPKKLPRTVQIGAATYTLGRSEIVDHEHRWGETSSSRRTIGFGVLCPNWRVPETLVHELLHAVAYEYGVELKESQVVPLGAGLTQALLSLGLLPLKLELP